MPRHLDHRQGDEAWLLAIRELRELRLHLHLCVVCESLRRLGQRITLNDLARHSDPAQARRLRPPVDDDEDLDLVAYLQRAPALAEWEAIGSALRRLAADPGTVRRFDRALAAGLDVCGPLARFLNDVIHRDRGARAHPRSPQPSAVRGVHPGAPGLSR
jgi:hypothetical protein